MKKLLCVLLSLLMMFSVPMCAFAEAAPVGSTAEAEESATGADEAFNYEDMPIWLVKVLLKVGKIVAKIVAAFAKIGIKTGIIDIQDIFSLFGGLTGGDSETTVEADDESDVTPSTAPVTEATQPTSDVA